MCTELNGMLNGPSPGLSLRMLHSFGLLPIVFECAKDSSPPENWTEMAVSLVKSIESLPTSSLLALGLTSSHASAEKSAGGHQGEPAIDAIEKETRRLLYLCAVLLPLAHCEVKAGKKPVPLPEYVIKTSLKGPIKDAQETGVSTRALGPETQSLEALSPE